MHKIHNIQHVMLQIFASKNRINKFYQGEMVNAYGKVYNMNMEIQRFDK